MKKEIVTLDYALIKLKQKVDVPNLPELCPDYRNKNSPVTVCGYPETELRQYKHSGEFMVHEDIGHYKIDTSPGYSGSPVYFMDNDRCFVIGIHKGVGGSIL